MFTAVEPEKIKPVVISGRKIQLNNTESDTVNITCKMQKSTLIFFVCFFCQEKNNKSMQNKENQKKT